MHIITDAGLAQILEVRDFIATRSPKAVLRYIDHIEADFFRLAPGFLSRRASDALPKPVRAASVSGFRGYTYHYIQIDQAIYLLSAFAPGLSDETKERLTRSSLSDLS